jgi:pimeloyl-ACP methyl ester carboxylesterase
MALGKRKRHVKQASMWVATQDLPRSAAHPFYMRLNQIIDRQDFDSYVERLCQRFYADEGRPGLPPRRYFRLLLIGCFEGLDAERAIAWRAVDSFALRDFLGLVLPEHRSFGHATLTGGRQSSGWISKTGPLQTALAMERPGEPEGMSRASEMAADGRARKCCQAKSSIPDLSSAHQRATPGEDFLRDADDICDLMGSGAHLLGHSYGGLGALRAAARSGRRAARSS